MAETETTEGRPQGTKRGDIEAQPEMVFPRVLSHLTARSLQTLAGRGAIGRKIREINDFQCIAAIDRKELTRAGNASAKSWRCPFRGGLYRRAQSLKRLPFVPFPAFNERLKVPPSRPLRRGLVDGGRGPVRHSSRIAARGGIGGRGDAKSGHGARASLS